MTVGSACDAGCELADFVMTTGASRVSLGRLKRGDDCW